ncbi:hypothetical protein ACN20G_16660 [Streptomyces sp. BI20]|uniref:hypothetical protein n=1 Tax=Streptomyces sp. BI20 TaxID=3403460 RepID=UPI003C78A52B
MDIRDECTTRNCPGHVYCEMCWGEICQICWLCDEGCSGGLDSGCPGRFIHVLSSAL